MRGRQGQLAAHLGAAASAISRLQAQQWPGLSRRGGQARQALQKCEIRGEGGGGAGRWARRKDGGNRGHGRCEGCEGEVLRGGAGPSAGGCGEPLPRGRRKAL